MKGYELISNLVRDCNRMIRFRAYFKGVRGRKTYQKKCGKIFIADKINSVKTTSYQSERNVTSFVDIFLGRLTFEEKRVCKFKAHFGYFRCNITVVNCAL